MIRKTSRTTLTALIAGAVIVAGVFAGAGTSQAAGAPRSATASAAPGHAPSFAAPVDSGLALQNRQLEAIERFRAIAAAAPDRFAGVSTNGPARVSVNLVGDPAKSAADVAEIRREAAAVGIAVSFPDRKHSLKELAAVQAAATDDAALASAATAPLSVAIDPATDSVVISSTGVTDALRAKARTRFGDAVTVQATASGTLSAGRFDDSPPYYGGDRIGNTSGYCTYGFSLTNASGTHYGITAGHCWAIGEGVDVTRETGGTDNLGAGYASFGTVQFRRFGNNSLDAELVGGIGYAGDIWVGPTIASSTTAVPVHGAHASCSGCKVYFNGSFTGMALATVDSNVPSCAQFTDPADNSTTTSCGVWQAHSTNGERICHAGDSGGPVFAYDGQGGVTAVGIIEACSGDGLTGWYTDINQILTTWSSSITTG